MMKKIVHLLAEPAVTAIDSGGSDSIGLKRNIAGKLRRGSDQHIASLVIAGRSGERYTA